MDARTELRPAPGDSVSGVRFMRHASANILAASDWTGAVNVYDVDNNKLFTKFTPHSQPALAVDFLGTEAVISGGGDMFVMSSPFQGEPYRLGQHAAAVSAVIAAPSVSPSAVVSGGWDSRLHLWDARTPGTAQASVELPGKVFSMDTLGANSLLVGTSGRYVYVYDLRALSSGPLQRRESPLRHQTRAVRGFGSGDGFAIGSVEGRVAIEWLDPSPAVQARRFAFKSHRRTERGYDVVYPVHAIAVHPRAPHLFATGGGDGRTHLWNRERQRRVSSFPKAPSSVVALDFNPDGSLLAVASSYCWEHGRLDPVPPTGIYITPVEHKS